MIRTRQEEPLINGTKRVKVGESYLFLLVYYLERECFYLFTEIEASQQDHCVVARYTTVFEHITVVESYEIIWLYFVLSVFTQITKRFVGIPMHILGLSNARIICSS